MIHKLIVAHDKQTSTHSQNHKTTLSTVVTGLLANQGQSPNLPTMFRISRSNYVITKNHRHHHKKNGGCPKINQNQIRNSQTKRYCNINTITIKQSTVIPRNKHQRIKTLITNCNTTLQNPKLEQRRKIHSNRIIT